MYSVHSEVKVKGKMDALSNEGFPMGNAQKVYKIGDTEIKGIKIIGTDLASPMVTDIVSKKYNKLIVYLTDLLTSDDDSGDAIREALNQIEKFRLEIKNKYRDYLKKKELDMMSKQLMILQKEATERYIELRNSFLKRDENKRSK